MKLNIISRFAVIAATTLGAVALHAESLPIRVSIPFAFTVSGHVMPSGEYSIKPLEGFSGVVALHHMTEGANLIALAQLGTEPSPSASLIFTMVDEGKALSMVKAPGWTLSFPVPASLAKTLAKKMEVPGVVAIAAAR